MPAALDDIYMKSRLVVFLASVNLKHATGQELELAPIPFFGNPKATP
jgi:hypothetical protein